MSISNFHSGRNFKLVIYSLTAGLLGFILSAYNISYEISNTTINIPWSLIFPVIASMLYGVRGALIASVFGGALFPFYLWAENGYANVLTSISIMSLYVLIGYVAQRNRDEQKTNLSVKELVLFVTAYTLFLWGVYRYLFNLFLSFNPAFWVDKSINHLPVDLLISFFVKNIINYLLIVQFTEAFIRIPFVRKIVDLPVKSWMRNNAMVFLFSIGAAVLIWFFYYLIDFFLSKESVGDKKYLTLAFMVLFWSGGIIGRVFIYYNESKLKTKDNLKQNQDQLDTIVSNIPFVVYRCLPDKHWTMLMVSPQVKDITGYSSEDFINNNTRSFASLVHPDDQKVLLEELNDNYFEGKTFELEYRIIDSFGNLHWIIDKGVYKFHPSGNGYVIDGFIHDITERKTTHLELEKYKNNLEQLVDERTNGLNKANKELEDALTQLKSAQSSLVQSEKMSSLGLLTAGIAHEINNPLNFIIRGYEGINSYFIKSNFILTDQNKEYLKSIENGVKRTSQIVKGLNLFSRSTDKMDEKCDIHSILDSTIAILGAQFKHKIDIKKNFAEIPFVTLGNVGKLHQVLINILTNSSQAIENKGMIVISTYSDNDWGVIEIADTGCGIEKEKLSKIFDPFYTTKEPGKGTGLGLSISYSIIEEHKGKIEVESKINVGTSVKIYLPLSIM